MNKHTTKGTDGMPNAGRLQAHCRALVQDLEVVMETVPEHLDKTVRHLFDRDIRRGHQLLKMGGDR